MAELQPKDSSLRYVPRLRSHNLLVDSLLVWCIKYTTVTIWLCFCSFPNLGILHVTKKNVGKTLEERMSEAYRLGYNYGVVIHPEIDSFQGETRLPRELTGNTECV